MEITPLTYNGDKYFSVFQIAGILNMSTPNIYKIFNSYQGFKIPISSYKLVKSFKEKDICELSNIISDTSFSFYKESAKLRRMKEIVDKYFSSKKSPSPSPLSERIEAVEYLIQSLSEIVEEKCKKQH